MFIPRQEGALNISLSLKVSGILPSFNKGSVNTHDFFFSFLLSQVCCSEVISIIWQRRKNARKELIPTAAYYIPSTVLGISSMLFHLIFTATLLGINNHKTGSGFSFSKNHIRINSN